MKYDFVNKPKHYNGHKLIVETSKGEKELATYETINLIDSVAERLEKIGVPAPVIYKILSGLKYYDRLGGGKPDGDKTIFEKLSEDLRKIGWYAVHAADQLDGETTKAEKPEKPEEQKKRLPDACKIYISGAISNDSNWKQKFKDAESKLKKAFPRASVISPLITEMYAEDSNWSYEDFMHLDLAIIDICDMIYFLDDWETSPGAKREREYAAEKNLPIIEHLI